MRVEPYGVGSVMHIVKRGARGMEIVRDEADKWRFVRMLYLLNDEYQDATRTEKRRSKSDLLQQQESLFHRPRSWPERKPLVAVLSWTLMSNHFHILLEEVKEGGVSKFMKRLCGSMSMAFNEKYDEKGSIFQGAYKSRTVDTDEYARYVVPYIAVKNVFELYPGGLKKALQNFDRAWQWAQTYPFSSFQTHALGKASPIIDELRLADLGIPTGTKFKKLSFDMLHAHKKQREEYESLLLEEW